MEFVTRPLASWDEVAATFYEMEQMVEALETRNVTDLAGEENDTAAAKTGLAEHRIRAPAPITAKPQATIGVSAMSIERLFALAQRLGNAGDNLADLDGGRTEFDSTVASPALNYALDVAVPAARQILDEAFQDLDAPPADLVVQEMVGLLGVIIKTLFDAYSNSGAELTDPKYAFPLMARTDFRSMFLTLEAEAQELFIRLWDEGPLREAFNSLYPLDQPIFPGGYTGADRRRYRGPRKGDWINTIIHGGDPRDSLSPPPAFPRHQDTARPEGIGAYGADEELLLFELRDLMGQGLLTVEKWVELAVAVARFAALAEEDAALMPPMR